jgi:phosphotransferase system enzyme I (PtsI)
MIYYGKSVFDAMAVGRILVYIRSEPVVKKAYTTDHDAEIDKFENAKAEALTQINDLYSNNGEEDSQKILTAHKFLMTDEDFTESVIQYIRQNNTNVEYAVAKVCENYAVIFDLIEDNYLKERIEDIRDVSKRMIRILTGTKESFEDFLSKRSNNKEPIILIAEDLVPSETIQLKKNTVSAFVMLKGSIVSHTAILAKTLGIPALVKTDIAIDSDFNGRLAIVDGYNGRIIIDPGEDALLNAEARIKRENEEKIMLEKIKSVESVTKDGTRVNLFANVGNIADIDNAVDVNAAGIGLFRTEYLFLEKERFPTENEQFQIYKYALDRMKGKPVLIRTLDVGSEKQATYLRIPHETNPALGLRGIRVTLERSKILRDQLRALLRASVYGNLYILHPMIISVDEIHKIKIILEEVKADLVKKNIPFGEFKHGIMIETPAAAILADEFAKEVDFFSIGTNDLTQYTLAIDRCNDTLKKSVLYDAKHPAVLRMIEMIVESAKKNGIFVGICGELASDESLLEYFVKMGVDEVSVLANRVLPLKRAVLELELGLESTTSPLTTTNL